MQLIQDGILKVEFHLGVNIYAIECSTLEVVTHHLVVQTVSGTFSGQSQREVVSRSMKTTCHWLRWWHYRGSLLAA